MTCVVTGRAYASIVGRRRVSWLPGGRRVDILETLTQYGPWGLLLSVVAYVVVRLIDRGFTFQVPSSRRRGRGQS